MNEDGGGEGVNGRKGGEETEEMEEDGREKREETNHSRRRLRPYCRHRQPSCNCVIARPLHASRASHPMLDGTRTRAEVLALPPRARLQAPTCSTAVALSQPAGRWRPRLMEGQPRLDLGSGQVSAPRQWGTRRGPKLPSGPPGRPRKRARKHAIAATALASSRLNSRCRRKRSGHWRGDVGMFGG